MSNDDVRRKYTGSLKRFVGAGALVLSIPDNIEAFMWRSGEELKSLKIGDTVTFEIGFNVFGAYARAPHSKLASSATSVS